MTNDDETGMTDKESGEGGSLTRKWGKSKPVSLSINQAKPIKVTRISGGNYQGKSNLGSSSIPVVPITGGFPAGNMSTVQVKSPKPQSVKATVTNFNKVLQIARKLLNEQIHTSYMFNQLTKKELQQERFNLGERRNVAIVNDLFSEDEFEIEAEVTKFAQSKPNTTITIDDRAKFSYPSTSNFFQEDIATMNKGFEEDSDKWVDLSLAEGTIVAMNSSYGNMPATALIREATETEDMKEDSYALFLGWKKEEIGPDEGKTFVYTQQWLYEGKVFAQNMPKECYEVIKSGGTARSFPWEK